MRCVYIFLSLFVLWAQVPTVWAWDEVGRARLKVGPFPIYTCRLLTPDGDYSVDEDAVRLELTYKRNIGSHHFLKHAKKEWAHQGLPEEVIATHAKALGGAFPDIKKGERLTYELTEDERGILYHNGDKIFEFTDPVLARNFLDIWLSEDTSRPKHRERLMGAR